MQGQEDIVEFYKRRFLPEFKLAFDAWIKLDPINNNSAPPGPDICHNIIVQRWKRQIA
jgi:hypothetical protein